MSGTQNSRASNTFAASLAHRFERTIRELTDINPKRFFAHAFGQTVSAGEGCLDEYQDHAGSSRRTLCVFHSPAGIPVTAPMTTATAKAFQPTHPSARNTVTAAPAMHRTQSGMNISLQPCFMIFLHQKYGKPTDTSRAGFRSIPDSQEPPPKRVSSHHRRIANVIPETLPHPSYL